MLTLVQGTVFDVSGNKAYGPEGSYKGNLKLLETGGCMVADAEQCSPAKMRRERWRNLL